MDLIKHCYVIAPMLLHRLLDVDNGERIEDLYDGVTLAVVNIDIEYTRL